MALLACLFKWETDFCLRRHITVDSPVNFHGHFCASACFASLD